MKRGAIVAGERRAFTSGSAAEPQPVFARPTGYRTVCRTHWHLCISAPPPDLELALPLLMFGFAQMASAEVGRQSPESRTQAGAELGPRAFAQLQPVV